MAKQKIPLKVKRTADKSWRYSFRGDQLIRTGDAGPAHYTEAQAYYKAFMECYGYEPDETEYPDGMLAAHDANGSYTDNYSNDNYGNAAGYDNYGYGEYAEQPYTKPPVTIDDLYAKFLGNTGAANDPDYVEGEDDELDAYLASMYEFYPPDEDNYEE